MSQTDVPAVPDSAVHEDEPQPEQARWYLAPKVDLAEDPSGKWGWHGHYPTTYRWVALAAIFSLLVMNIGNHRGHVEDVWLDAVAAVIGVWLIVDILSKRGKWKN